MFQKLHLFLWLVLFISSLALSCKSQPETINESQKETTQMPDSLPLENDPCIPPPPCLDPWERPITLRIQTDEEHAENFRILASKKPNASSNYTITTQRDSTKNLFEIECNQPFRLAKGKNNSIELYIKKTGGTFHTLTIKFREEEISCCPRLIPDEIRFNEKVVCNNCERGKVIKLQE